MNNKLTDQVMSEAADMTPEQKALLKDAKDLVKQVQKIIAAPGFGVGTSKNYKPDSDKAVETGSRLLSTLEFNIRQLPYDIEHDQMDNLPDTMRGIKAAITRAKKFVEKWS